MTVKEAILTLNANAVFACERAGFSSAAVKMIEDALDTIEDALKAQEPIEARLHLCDSCKKQYPECDATKDGVAFGSGTGNDNIIGCTAYVNRWMPQNEPRVMTLEEYDA